MESPGTDGLETQASPSASVDTFIHVADLHFWKVVANPLRLLNKRVLGNLNVWLRRRHEFPMDAPGRFIEALAAIDTRQLVLTGDFSSTSLDEEFRLARRLVDDLHERGFHLHLLPGNHDVYTFEARRRAHFERHFASYLPADGFPALERLPGGTSLLLVPTVCPNFVSAKGRITHADIGRAAALLEGASPVVVVAGHYPLLERTSGYVLTRDRRLRNADALREALGRSGRSILYVAGHVHRFSYVRDPEFPSLRHLCTGAFFRRNRREGIRGEFSVVQVLRDGFRVERHGLRDTWKAEAAPLLHADGPP